MKIKLEDTKFDIILQMSKGNPGAMSTLMSIIDDEQLLPILLTLNKENIYGSHIYMLWNDCCDRNNAEFKKTVLAIANKKISRKDLEERLLNVGYGKEFKDLLDDAI